jgi:hypothetical protein
MKAMTSDRGLSPWGRVALILLLCVALLPGMTAAAPQAPPAPAEPARPDAAPPGQVEEAEERRITPEEAEELFRSIDNILEFVSEETGMAVHRPVKRELSGRQAVQDHIEERLEEDEDAQRLQRSEAVLKKFGLLPRDFDLRPFLIALMREQVAGFYNFRTGTVHLLDWVDPETQLPLLAHELTHAVQDQNFPLEEWIRGPRRAGAKGVELEIDMASDEMSAARQAVIEGQAMVVLVNFLLAPTGRSVLDSSDIVNAIQAAMTDSSNSPQFARAPLFIREALTFPYRHGMNFVLEVLRREGPERAFVGLMRDPPRNTRHILLPQTYLTNEKLPELAVPDLQTIMRRYEPFDAGAIGQFDVDVLMQQYGAGAGAGRISEAWRSGYYYAAQPKGQKDGALGLVYVSLWATAEDAAEFARVYSAAVPQRYPGAEAKGTDLEWRTDEGEVTVEQRGDLVLVMESLDARTARDVRRAVLKDGK